MPLTGVERSKNNRKLEANVEMYGAYKEEERVWKRESRTKAPSPRKAVAERRKCRERVRLHKLRKKLSTSQDANGTDLEFAYKSPQASGKAVHKIPPFFQTAQGNRKQLLQRLQSQVDFLYQVNTRSQMVTHALPSPQ